MKPRKSSLVVLAAGAVLVLVSALPAAAQEAPPRATGDEARVDAAATQDFTTLGLFTLPAGGSVTLEFDAMVNPVIPAGVTAVANQGSADADQLAAPAASDDPTTGAVDDATITQLLVEAELGVTKTDNPAAATSVPGTQIQYDVVVSNAGPFGVLDVPVTDTFPAALANCSWSCGGTGNCDAANGNGDVNTTVDLEAGQSVTFVITCDVDPAATTTLINTAAVTAPVGVSDPGNVANSDDDVNTLTPQGDLTISKVTNTMPVVPGNAIQYEITVANSGPSDAVGVDVDDVFPAAVTGVTWTCAPAGGAACPNGAGNGDLAETVDLPAGGSLTYTVDGTVDAGAVGSIDNTATLTVPAGFTDTTDGDAVAGSESDTVTDTLNPEGDVAVTKTTLTSPVVPGAAVQYQIAVTNPGPSDALGVNLTDTFPGAVSGVSWTCAASAGSACSAAAGNGNLNESIDVAASGTVTYTVTGTVDAAATGDLVNTASVTPPAGFADGSTGNDDDTVTDTLEPQGNLAVDKTTLTSPVVAGLPVQYQIVVTNSGPSTATGAQVQDNFAADLANESWTCVASAGSSCTAADNGDVLDAVTLLPGGSVTYSVTADLAANAASPLNNTAVVTAPAGFTDTNGADDSDAVSNAVAQQVDLTLDKDDGGGAVNGVITYTITLTNAGPGDVTGVTVSDVFPAGLINVQWTCVGSGGATCTAGPVNGDVNDSVDLPANSMVVYTITADVDTGDPVTNTASATLPAGAVDPSPDDNEDQVVTSFATILEIPTLSQVGLVLLVLLLAGLGLARLRRRGAVVGLALLLALAGAGAADAQVLIDDFSTAQGPNEDPPGGPPPASSTADTGGADILGSERDLAMRLISGAGPVTGEVTGGQLDFGAPAGSRGEAELTWDGNDDDATALDPVGLGGVDLTGGGALSGFRFTIDQAAADLELILRVYTDGSNHSQAGRLITSAINSATPVFIPFSELRTVAGSGADLANVGAVVLVVRGENATLLLDRLETLGPDLLVTKVDLNPNTNTELGATQVPAGSTIRYRIELQNQGGDATTVDVTDVVDSNTTLLPNTLNSTPVAVGDAYRWFGNVTLVADGVGFPTLLANDTDPDGDAITVTSIDASSARLGSVTLDDASTGAFTYVPPAGERGIDSFTYSIQDDDGNVSTAVATIQLEQTVWFVDSTNCGPAPCGDGTQANAFGSLVEAQNVSAAGDVIRLRQGNDDAEELARHNVGLTLKEGQKLIGEGVDLILSGIHIEGLGTADGNLDANAANRPRITHGGGGNGLTLADSVEILGLDVVGSDDSGVFGSNVDAVTIDHLAVVDSGGAALEVVNGTNLSLTFSGLDSLSSSEHGLVLDGVTGTLNVTGTTQIDDPAEAGILIEDSPGFSATFGAVNVVDAGGAFANAALRLGNSAGATFTFGTLDLDSENGDGFVASSAGTVNHPSSGNVVNAVGGAAVDIQSTTGNAGGSPGWSFDTLTSTNSPDHGVRLVSLSDDFTVGSASTTVTDADVVGILVQNSAAGTDYDFGATSVTDTNVGAGATANGIDLATGNANATFTFDSLEVVTDGGFGLLANDSGAIAIAGTGNSIAANGGPALDVTSTTLDEVVGGAVTGVTFADLSSTNTAGDGINLDAVSGGVTGSGGSIVNSGGIAVDVNAHGSPFTYDGTIDNNGGRSVEITNSGGGTANTLAFGGAIDDDGAGIFLDNNDQNAGATVNFSGGVDLDTNTTTAFQATNGGTVNVTGTNRIGSTSALDATAVSITDTTIGGLGVTFQEIHVDQSASGGDTAAIILDDTGAGAFSVTGVGSTGGSGGTIQDVVEDAVRLFNTDGPVSLANMIIEDIGDTGTAAPGHHGIDGQQVDGGLTLDNVVIRRVTDSAVHGEAPGGGSTTWNGLTVTDSTLAFSNRFHVAGQADGGATDEAMITVEGISGTVLINDNDFDQGPGFVNLFTASSGSVDITVQSNTMDDGRKDLANQASVGSTGIRVNTTGTIDADIRIGDPAETNNALGNVLTDTGSDAGIIVSGFTAGDAANVDLVISRNSITVNDHTSPPGLCEPADGILGCAFDFPNGGIGVESRGSGTFEAIISHNTLTETQNSGGLSTGSLRVDVSGDDTEVIVRNNTLVRSWDGTLFIRADDADGNGARGFLLIQDNVYQAGLIGESGSGDDLDAHGLADSDAPFLPGRFQVRNGAVLDLTVLNDDMVSHDTASNPQFDSLDIRINGDTVSAPGSTSILNVLIQNTEAPEGFRFRNDDSGIDGTDSEMNLSRGLSADAAATDINDAQADSVLDDNGNTTGGGGSVADVPFSGVNIVTTTPTLPVVTAP